MKTEEIRAMALALEAVKSKKLDPVGKHDKDIDNDGDHDKTDKYLIKRRNTVSKAVAKDKNNVEVQVQESVEELDEISDDKLLSYIGKASISREKAKTAAERGMNLKRPNDKSITNTSKALKTFKKRRDGMIKAAHKMREEVERIEELSKKTLGSYVAKAKTSADDLSDRAYTAGAKSRNAEKLANRASKGGTKLTPSGIKKLTMRDYSKATSDANKHSRDAAKLNKKHASRLSGIEKATNRLTKEEVERIEELSKKTLGSYVNKAADDLDNTSYTAGQQSSDRMLRRRLIKHTNKRLDGIRKATNRLTKESLDEGYKENQDRWVEKVSEVSSEIESMAANLVSAHKAACEAADRIQATYAKGGVPSEADRKAADQKLYDVKYLVRQLEDVRDTLENKSRTETVDAVVSVKRYYESVEPSTAQPISIRDALGIMENRALQTAGATPPEKMDDKISADAKKWMGIHAVQTPDESNIDAATAKNKIEIGKSLQRSVDYRHNDQKIGDK